MLSKIFMLFSCFLELEEELNCIMTLSVSSFIESFSFSGTSLNISLGIVFDISLI